MLLSQKFTVRRAIAIASQEEGDLMGFFAGELERVLSIRQENSPWSILSRMGVHPQQVDRLKKAQDDISQVATLQQSYLDQLRIEIDLTRDEWARLHSGMHADTVLRLFLYHNYPLEQAARMANAIYLDTLQNMLMASGELENIYAPDIGGQDEQKPGPRRMRLRKPQTLPSE